MHLHAKEESVPPVPPPPVTGPSPRQRLSKNPLVAMLLLSSKNTGNLLICVPQDVNRDTVTQSRKCLFYADNTSLHFPCFRVEMKLKAEAGKKFDVETEKEPLLTCRFALDEIIMER